LGHRCGSGVRRGIYAPSVSAGRFTLERDGVELSGLSGGGDGDLVVLLHGLAGSAAEMVPLGEALGRRYVALDQRGHGLSTRRPGDLSRPAFVDDVVAVLGEEPAWLVGQSMGAHTAMLVAAQRPVKGLVMISGGVGGSTDDYPKKLGAWFASWPVPFADEAAARGFLGDAPITEAWARVETIAGAGHDVHLEQRDHVAQLIRCFIDGCSARPPRGCAPPPPDPAVPRTPG